MLIRPELELDEYNEKGKGKYHIDIKLDIPEKVVAMSSGTSESIFVITENGNVYCWGENTNGQLGLGHCQIIDTPEKNPYLKNIKQISTSSTFTLALDNDGQVYGFGSNRDFQISDKAEQYTFPEKVNDIPKIERIATTKNSSAVIDENGNVYTWGNNDFLQLGYEGKNGQKPHKLDISTKFVDIIGGFGHVVLYDEDSFVWGFGSTYNGQLGIGKDLENSLPVKTNQKAKKITAYHDVTVVIDENDRIYYSGYPLFDAKTKAVINKKIFSDFELIGMDKVKNVRIDNSYAVFERKNRGDLLLTGYHKPLIDLLGETPLTQTDITKWMDDLSPIDSVIIAKSDEFVDYFVNSEGVFIIKQNGDLHKIWRHVEVDK